MKKVVIVSAVRTGIGAFNGALSSLSATELGATVITEVIERSGLKNEQIDEVIMGNVLPHGLGQNPARQAVLKAELPYDTGALTINKVCGSGLKAVMLASQAIACGDADVIIAGGMENMTRAPYYMEKARSGYRMGHGELVDAMIHDGLWDINNDFHMGFTAELISDKFNISREEMDKFTLRSYELALAANESGAWDEERMTLKIPQRKGEPLEFCDDESVRATSMETLAKLRAAFKKGGLVTAGNSSKIADGAAALLLTSLDFAQENNLEILAHVGAQASAGVDPKDVLVAPINAIPKVLKKADLTIEDIDLYEVNEAFATSTVAVMNELSIPLEKLNVNGGSVALGHPIGASGARVLITLLYALKQRQLKRGLATLCLGGGEAVALIVERP